MKPLVSIICVTVVLLSLTHRSAGQDAKPLEAPVSNTDYARRIVEIVWEPGATPPDITRVLKKLYGVEAQAIGQDLLNIKPDVDRLIMFTPVEVKDHSWKFSFDVSIDLANPGARPAAKEVADALIERLSSLLNDQRRIHAAGQLQQADEQKQEAQASLKDFRRRVMEARTRLSAEANRADLSLATLQSSIGKLEDERQRLELELAGMEARLEAVQEQFKKSAMSAERDAASDPVIPELEKAALARERQLQLARAVGIDGGTKQAEVSKAEADLIDARVQLLDRRGAAAARSGEALSSLTREMQMIAIDVRDRKARLARVESRLKALSQVTEGFQELEWMQEDAVGVRQALDDANTHLRELRRQANATPVDRVIVTHASDSGASPP